MSGSFSLRREHSIRRASLRNGAINIQRWKRVRWAQKRASRQLRMLSDLSPARATKHTPPDHKRSPEATDRNLLTQAHLTAISQPRLTVRLQRLPPFDPAALP